jgi:glycosyltransferase involved in cell wall biosynthesis
VVIYPPIDTAFFDLPVQQPRRNYFLFASRLEPYKRADLVIEAFSQLKLPLKIAGDGTHLSYLRRIAGSNIEFLGRVPDAALRELYQNALAFVYPAEEDAGMMLLESNACGTPVIAYARGGAVEILREGESAVFFHEQSVSAIRDAVAGFRFERFDSKRIRKHAESFGKEVFKERLRNFLHEKLAEFRARM